MCLVKTLALELSIWPQARKQNKTGKSGKSFQPKTRTLKYQASNPEDLGMRTLKNRNKRKLGGIPWRSSD